MALFVTFEGTEGSGKSTQSNLLVKFLKQKGFKAVHIWDPGSTLTGEAIREVLLSPSSKILAQAEMFLYMAARAQLVNEKIMPALKKNMIVVCDRFIDATVCYQGYGLGIDVNLINRLNRIVTKGITPDLTFFLDVEVRKGLKRCKTVKGSYDRIERRDIAFHNKVRNGYIALSKKYPKRIKRLSTQAHSKEQIQKIIRKIVLDAIK